MGVTNPRSEVLRRLINSVKEVSGLTECKNVFKKLHGNLVRRIKLLSPLFEELRDSNEGLSQASKQEFSDLISNVSRVCHSWQLSCWHVLCWKTWRIDILDLIVIRPPIRTCTTSLETYNHKLMQLLKSITDYNHQYIISLLGWASSIQTLIIRAHLKISDKHLLYLSKRTVGLQRLTLYGSSNITDKGFAKAISYWKNIKSIHLNMGIKYVNQVIVEIGKNCSSLEFLCIQNYDFHVRHETAVVIVKSLLKLKRLRFDSAYLHRDVLYYIYSTNLLGIQSIYFHSCFLLNDDESTESADFTLFRSESCGKWLFQSESADFTLFRSESYGKFQSQELETKMLRWMNSEV